MSQIVTKIATVKHCVETQSTSVQQLFYQVENIPGVSIRFLSVPTVPAQCYHTRKVTNYSAPADARQIMRLIRVHYPGLTVQFMRQNHSNECAIVSRKSLIMPQADACVTQERMLAPSVYSADCVPVLIADTDGQTVAAVHAGWRGLYSGVILATLKKFTVKTDQLTAWIGPSICHKCYQVSHHFKQQFCAQAPSAHAYFTTLGDATYFDCPGFAMHQLQSYGLRSIHQINVCTSCTPELPSYRREQGRIRTRLLSLIWKS